MNLIKKLHNRLKDYVFDSTLDLKERTFIMLSVTVLFALFAAIPCGLIMHEPLSSTISTAFGAVVFTLYVVISFKRRRIARAKVVISVILVFIFLPAMLFSNGGVGSGAPIWLLLGTIYISMILDGNLRRMMIVMEGIVLIICWVVA